MPRRRLILPLLTAAVGVVLLVVGALADASLVAGLGGLGLGLGIGFFAGGRRNAEKPALPATPAVPVATPAASDLNDFELRAKVKGDFAVANLADRLDKLRPRLESALAAGGSEAGELGYKLHRLYDTALGCVRRAFELHLASREMATSKARDTVRLQRQELVDEATSAVGALDVGIDRLATAAATAGASEKREQLADLNGDLDRQLEVARRVDERMRQLEAKARGDLSAAEKYVEQPLS